VCNLYTQRLSAAEVASHFGVSPPIPQTNAGEEVYPGASGIVVREQNGIRLMQSMTWGFPLRLKFMKPESKPKPVNNIADLNKGMWVGLAKKPQWRCIIPGTAFAEAEGPKGAKTRTWFSMKGHALFGWGGLWRESAEWGPVYSGAMTDCNEAIRPVHDRMPVLLMADEYDRWLNGSFEDLLGFQNRCFPDDLIEMRRTDELWSRTSKAAKAQGIQL
jgi:putative SOS response-associated peptidase YedK